MIHAYCDGLCEPRNPGGYGAWGVVIEKVEISAREGEHREVVERAHGVLGWGVTNNMAEYTSAIEAVKLANKMFPGLSKVLLGDSQLVIRQINGQYAVRSERIAPLHRTLSEEMRRDRGTWTAKWIPREENAAADEESRKAVVEAIGKWPERGRLVDVPGIIHLAADEYIAHNVAPKRLAGQANLERFG